MKNEQLQKLMAQLKKLSMEQEVAIWKAVADDLSSGTRRRRIVNLYKIDKYAQDGETIVVPGKVLSVGNLSKKVTVAAHQFSGEAAEKINSQGKAITIQELMKSNPKGQKVRILG